MQVLIYIVLAGVCTFFVWKVMSELKRRHGICFSRSPSIELCITLLCGIILAGIVKFLLIYILIPLMLLLLVLGLAKSIKK